MTFVEKAARFIRDLHTLHVLQVNDKYFLSVNKDDTYCLTLQFCSEIYDIPKEVIEKTVREEFSEDDFTITILDYPYRIICTQNSK